MNALPPLLTHILLYPVTLYFHLQIKHSFFKEIFLNSDRIKTFSLCCHSLPFLTFMHPVIMNLIPSSLLVCEFHQGLCLFCLPLPSEVPSCGAALNNVCCSENYNIQGSFLGYNFLSCWLST